MSENKPKIDPLCKVGITLSNQAWNKAPLPLSKTKELFFIYGIGSQGITPFEKKLHNKKVGEQITIDIDHSENHAFFGHLQCLFMESLAAKKNSQLHICIQSVTLASTQEIVKAMAQGSECGSGCSCGCC
jgi:hypothetical protein